MGPERVLAGDASLEPGDPDLQALGVHVLALQQAHLAGPEAVGVGNQDQRLVPLVVDDAQEALEFLLGQVVDGVRLHSRSGPGLRP